MYISDTENTKYKNTDFIKQFLTSVVRTVHIFMVRSRVSKRYLVVEL